MSIMIRYEGEADILVRSGHIRPQGQGTMTYLGGDWAGYRYEGEFLGERNGHPHGQGKWYRWSEGEWRLEYEGECQRGEYHGQGTLYNSDGTIQRQGRWADGEPIDDNAAP